MSNAFRTPIIDFVRNVLVQSLPFIRREGSFSLRLQRGSVYNTLRVWKLRRKLAKAIDSKDSKTLENSLQELQQILGCLNPLIVGSGLWFRFWTRILRNSTQKYISNQSCRCQLLEEALVNCSSFACPFEVTVMRNPSLSLEPLQHATNRFQRNVASTLLKFPKLFFHPNEVKGLEFQKRRLESHSPSTWGQYEIRCDHNGEDFSGFIHNRATREKILSEYHKVYDDREYLASIIELLKERKRLANQLGFESWSELQTVKNLIGNHENDGIQFLSSVYQHGLPQIKSLLSKMRMSCSSNALNDKEISSVDEMYILTQWRNPSKLIVPKAFEYERTLERITKCLGQLFRVNFVQVPNSLSLDGWHKTVKIYAVFRNNETSKVPIGHIYIDLFKRPFSPLFGSGGPHCSVLHPADRHVRIYMGLQPPYRSDITLKKERFFTYEEITALMHELGHALHIILRPPGSPLSQLPLDIREAVSVLCELYSFTDQCIDSISEKQIAPHDKHIVKRDEWFYLDIIRNVAVMEAIHSTKYNPFVDGPETLRSLSRDIYQEFSPIRVSDFVNPLGGELANYLIDGESRVGYLQSYIRASGMIPKHDEQIADSGPIWDLIRGTYPPSATLALESSIRGRTITPHPLPKISQTISKGFIGANTFVCVSALWKTCMHSPRPKRVN